MKHILNNLSPDEKKRILEQHGGGMNLEIKNFKRLVENKLGSINPLVEQSDDDISPLDTYGIFDDIKNDLMEMSDDDRAYYLQSIIDFCQDLLDNSEYDDDDDDDDDKLSKQANRTIFGGGEYDYL